MIAIRTINPIINPTINPIEFVEVEELFIPFEFVVVEDVNEAEGVDEVIGDKGVDERFGEGVGTVVQLHFETLLQSVMRLFSKSLHIFKRNEQVNEK